MAVEYAKVEKDYSCLGTLPNGSLPTHSSVVVAVASESTLIGGSPPIPLGTCERKFSICSRIAALNSWSIFIRTALSVVVVASPQSLRMRSDWSGINT